MNKFLSALFVTTSLLALSSGAYADAISDSAISFPTDLNLDSLGDSPTVGFHSTLTDEIAAGTLSVASDVTSITFSGTAGVYSGNVSDVVATPLPSNTEANFLSAEPGGDITINLNGAMTSFGLLWGSVDTYNTLTFNDVDGGTQSITGAQLLADNASLVNGTTNVEVLFSDLNPFTSVTFDSTQAAFEFMPDSTATVSEPASLALMLGGLLLFGMYNMRVIPKSLPSR